MRIYCRSKACIVFRLLCSQTNLIWGITYNCIYFHIFRFFYFPKSFAISECINYEFGLLGYVLN